MSKIFALSAALVLATTLGTAGASAHSQRDATIDANQAVQLQRIEQGRYTGEINRREYRALLAEQARIAEMERAAKADGWISRREYKSIHDAQIDAYRAIKSESSDRDVSFWRRWLYRTR
jgi:hypothetical protein